MNQNEIGGFIEFEHFSGKEYHKNCVCLNSGVSCLSYLIKVYNIKTIYLPYYLCDSIKEVCEKNNVTYYYYNISKDFKPIFPENFVKDSWFYFVNFYSQFSNFYIKRISRKINNLIVDNVQSFFQKPVKNIPTIYTCRKYFGVPNGAYLYTPKLLNEVLEKDYSYNKLEYLIGRFEKSANEFYQKYIEHEEEFRNTPILQMSSFTRNLLCVINYRKSLFIRKINFLYLNAKLWKINKLKLHRVSSFMYPLFIENGCLIRKKLQTKKIYLPTLWPNVLIDCDTESIEYKYTNNILLIPIDQRYGIEEMKYIIKEIKNEYKR